MADIMKALAERQAETCRVFANPTRILILWTLADHEKSVGEIAQAVGASLQSTSQHLRIMKDENILAARREGQMVFYHVVGSAATARCRRLLEIVPQGADSLKAVSES